MPEKDKKIMAACADLVKHLDEHEKERFLNFTEGMAFLSSRMVRTTDAAPRPEPQKLLEHESERI